MNQSENIADLASALSKAQGEIQGAKKDCANPFFKSKYADLSSVWDACREPLTKNGLSVIQATAERDGHIYLYTTLAHSSGQWIRSEIKVIVGKPDIQALGSSLTYCRRYSLAMIAGVCPEDDDGNLASNKVKEPEKEVIHRLGPNAIKELMVLMSKCSPGCEKWLLDKVFENSKDERTIENIPLNYFDFCKKGIEAFYQNEERQKGKANE